MSVTASLHQIPVHLVRVIIKSAARCINENFPTPVFPFLLSAVARFAKGVWTAEFPHAHVLERFFFFLLILSLSFLHSFVCMYLDNGYKE